MAKKKQSPKIRKLYIVGSVLIVLGYLALFGFTYPPCAERDIIHPIPPHLQGATIRFESGSAVLWKYGKRSFGLQCTPIAKQEEGYVMYEYPHLIADIKQGKAPGLRYVPPEEGLKLRYIVTRKCSPFLPSCFENGTTSMYLILEDSEGKLWRNIAISNDVLKLVYYQNGEKQGGLKLRDYFSRKDGLIL